MEDRPIYVFDEWAADQDPTFRDVFYLEILPELKRRGKAVIVISHDDRYYDTGDRLVKMVYGEIEGIVGAASEQAAESLAGQVPRSGT
jgi:putative ATP-binding cassette transporter